MENVMFHNVGEFRDLPGIGASLSRIPSDVRYQLNAPARMQGASSVGCEVRFVTDAPFIRVTASIQLHDNISNTEIRIYKGNFLMETRFVSEPTIQIMHLKSAANFKAANDNLLNTKGFSSDVWRIVFGRGLAVLHDIDTYGYPMRAPRADELPKLKWLAYGSSITMSNLDGYEHVTARILGADVQNMGIAGACHIESELVDYMIEHREFDFISCELGVNMRNLFTPEEFEIRVKYLIERISQTGKPAIIIPIFPNRDAEHYAADPTSKVSMNNGAFNAIVKRLVEQSNAPQIHFVDGGQILDDMTGLSGDLLHPSPFGHAMMGVNLANIIQKLKESGNFAIACEG